MQKTEKCEDGHIMVNFERNEIYFNAGINEDSMTKLIEYLLTMENNINKKVKSLKRKFADITKDLDKDIDLIKDNKLDNKLDNNKDKIIVDNSTNFKISIESRPIKLYITSPGGSIHQVFSAIDTINSMTTPIHTICKGMVASAGTLLSLSGTIKSITENSYMLIHELRSGAWGKYSFLKDNYDNCTQLMEHLKNYYIKKTKITREELDIQLTKDQYWNAETCLAKGLVDNIICK